MTSPSTVRTTEIVFPDQANHYGTLFGGNALMLMAKTAFLAARGFAQRDVVMASVADAQFLARVPVGSILVLDGWVTRAGRTSMTVCVSGALQEPGTLGAVVLKGLFEMVAVDSEGRPAPLAAAYLPRSTEPTAQENP